jgi:hypothetical protein
MSALADVAPAVAKDNARCQAALDEDFAHLERQLDRRRFDIESLVARAMAFRVAIPSWGVGTGGTRFARFPGPGEPRTLLQLIRAANERRGKRPALRTDLRLDPGPDGGVFVLNKHDGIVRLLVP